MTGGELISAVLAQHRIGTVFALAGAAHTYLLDPLERSGCRIVSARHEAGAVGGADGYSRVSGKPGIALIVADQGLPNAVGALAVAWHACTPVVALAATPPKASVETDSGIDQDKLALVASISKWARTVPGGTRLEDYLRTALRHAVAGRPGPVVLMIPEEILGADVAAPSPSPLPPASRPQPAAAAIAAAADTLAAAEKPLLIAGTGVAWGDAAAGLARLNGEFGLPVLANGLGRGMLAEDNETVCSWPYAQPAAGEADVVVVAGARLTQRLGLGLPPRFSAAARFIQIDIDAGAMHRNRPATHAIHADAGAALAALAAALAERGHPRWDTGWLGAALAPRKARIAELEAARGPAIHPLRLGAELMRRLPADAVYVGDGADIQTWMYGAIRIRRPRGFLDHYPMGAMGSGTALAVGAAAALRERHGADAPPTVLVTGDGAIGFHPAELHAAARAGLKLIVVVGNDGAWGTEAHGQTLAIGRRINTELGQLPYEHLATAFGCLGLCARQPGELAGVLDDAFAADRPALVNVLLDPDAGAELKHNPDVRMILFSDILEGQADLGRFAPDD
ncbi:MAG: thiamine pyrophosphate-binding protein [Pseudomonadota bacterium]